ncbi:hypothetical protein SCLCIDRAFT_16109 [Scleroderma citrinum Foug A]|uniref:Uncharacterized protein n=1 Tax=Scleroderma citrinum Foug A TaxID=1036808 RepID=A0A0C3DZ00_9AGAM|nr:hypothetical protein SCLCIDRAFT_16109 [Scleroderma citrinum Foug A]
MPSPLIDKLCGCSLIRPPKSALQLVTPTQLKGHLALLHAFHTLKTSVQDGNDSRFPAAARKLDERRRWAWFVALAVERFERWCVTIEDMDVEWRGLPPIDVAMVWHAYLLNPSWYAEDTMRIPILGTLAKYNQAMSTCLEFPTLLTTETPHHQRTETWCLRTGTPYHPFDAVVNLTHKSIECPQCTWGLSVAFLDTDGMGYSQENFKTTCLCGFRITMDNLGMYKFVKNIIEQNPPASYLAGSLHTPHNSNDTLRAEGMKQAIARARPLARMIARVLGAYTDDRLFSVDLVGAVLRQASFVQKMHDLGWTNPGFFDSEEDAIVLKHCITRYHAFLGLMAESQGSFFVPTIDIDLAWHTHQLLARRYQEDCLELVGRYVNHDDKVEEDKLATSFDVTCRAWQDRYGVPYMYCGCPPPGERFGQRLRRLFSDGNLKGDHPGSSLVPTDDATARAATHPSDHNAVFLMHKQTQAMHAREKRKKKMEERRIKAEKAASRDVLDVPFVRLEAIMFI